MISKAGWTCKVCAFGRRIRGANPDLVMLCDVCVFFDFLHQPTYVLGALDGFKQLISVKKTSGFLGLGRREHSTGERVRQGAITAVGDPNARKMIIQASWVALKKDLELKITYDNVCSKNPEKIRRQKAIVAVARKMICRIHAVLRDQRFFEERLKKTA